MSYTYLPHFRADGLRAFVPFLLKRVARIMPLGFFVLLVILLLGGIAALWGRSDLFINQNAVQAGLVTSIIVNILHLQGFSYVYNLNDPSWSVSLEMSAYLVFPLLIYVVFDGPRLLTLAYLLVGTTVLASAAIAHPRLALSDADGRSDRRHAMLYGIRLWNAGLSIVRDDRTAERTRQGFYGPGPSPCWRCSCWCFGSTCWRCLLLILPRQDR